MKGFSENLKTLEDIFDILKKDLLSIDLTESYVNKAEDVIYQMSQDIELDNFNDEKFLSYEECLKTLESFKKKLVLKRIGEFSDVNILLEKDHDNKLNENTQKNIHEEIEKEIKIELSKIKDKGDKSLYNLIKNLIKNLWKKIF